MTLCVRVVVLTCVLAGGAWDSTASAGWLQDGIDWRAWPSGDSGGMDCFGNCGSGCTDRVIFGFGAPCDGPPQYWSLAFVAGPDLVASGTAESCIDYGDGNGAWVSETWETYHAIGVWTYHGWVTLGCILHDAQCRSRSPADFWQLLGCVTFSGCGDPQWEDSWSYQQWMVGVRQTDRTFLAWSPCT